MNKEEFIKAVEKNPSLLDNYKEVEIDDGARGHHTAIQFKDCDEPFEFGELIDYFEGMPIVEQMYCAALAMADSQQKVYRFYTEKPISKKRFIELLKENPELYYKSSIYHIGEKPYVYFDECSELFEPEELKEIIWKNLPISQGTRSSLSYLELEGFDNPSCKLSYASHIDTPPHKTGVPMEWLDELE